MSVLMLDKESNKYITVTTGETNFKEAPKFSGMASSQDPMLFIESYKRVAKWNNWKSDERLKEMFLLNLVGLADTWAENNIKNDPNYEAMPFEDTKDNEGLLTKFRERYVTEDWLEIYVQQYEDRRQDDEELPTEYLEHKRYLFQRTGDYQVDVKDKQQIREVIKGLRPEVAKFCEMKTKDPFNTEAKKAMDSFEGLTKLLMWAETCLYKKKTMGVMFPEGETRAIVQVNNVTRKPNGHNTRHQHKTQGNEGQIYQRNNGYQSKNSDFESLVLSKLDKLEDIENDLAALKDRVVAVERGTRNQATGTSSSGNTGSKWVDGAPRCFNCQQVVILGENVHNLVALVPIVTIVVGIAP
ncbi:hypothetical protein BD560DRAFT_428098 [Blakeslea trispora]|nr:hypothetical protein BD560DRAFT_428098 [Blakeslea trispora]